MPKTKHVKKTAHLTKVRQDSTYCDIIMVKAVQNASAARTITSFFFLDFMSMVLLIFMFLTFLIGVSTYHNPQMTPSSLITYAVDGVLLFPATGLHPRYKINVATRNAKEAANTSNVWIIHLLVSLF